jgi:hypothetical protein
MEENKTMKKITLSLAFASLLASSAMASDNYRIFLGAYSGPTEEFVKDVAPKLKDVAGIGEVIAEKRGSKTYVFVDVNEPGATAARNLLPTVREKSGIADAYVLMVKDKEDLKKEEAIKPSIVITDSNKPVHISEKTVQVEKKKELNLSLPVAEPETPKKVEKKPELLLKPKKTLEPSFKTVKIEKAKELSEIIGEAKKEQPKKVETPKKVEKKVEKKIEKVVEEENPITPRPKETIQKANDGLKGSGYNFYQIKKHPEKNSTAEVKDFDALLKARAKAAEAQK